MLGSPLSPVLLVATYLVFILKLGPALMEKRKPFILKTPLLIYNTFQVLFSVYAFYRVCIISNSMLTPNFIQIS